MHTSTVSLDRPYNSCSPDVSTITTKDDR